MPQRIASIDIGEMASIANLKVEELARVVKRQSQPRRWPWQPKTLYDQAHERSGEVVALAAERAAALAAAAAQERSRIAALVAKQSQPRRWPWQPKTARDRLDERRAVVAEYAATLSARLAELAARRRDSLLDQVRKQSQPRRWPWQAKTTRDRLNERGAALRAAASGVAGQVVDTASSARHTVRETASAAPQTLGTTAGAAAATLHDAAEAVRHRVSDTREAAAQTLHGAAETARQRVSETGGAVTDAIAGRVDATTGAINETIAAGQRRVRRGVRLARWSFWSFVGGVVTGVLVAPRSGEETRRELTAAAQHLGSTIFPPDQV